MKIYISGQISGLPYEVARRNFRDAENELKKKYPEAKIVNPMRSILPKWTKWEWHMILDLYRLSKCTNIYFIDGWGDSHGAMIERIWSKKLGIITLCKNNKEKGE